ncbi:MAG: hypothetical protein ACLSE8_01285 [Parasutterella sp.]
MVEDSSVAIDLYRLRGLIEQGFDQLKNQLPGRRLRVTEASHLGKLLVYLIGCDLRLPDSAQPDASTGTWAELEDGVAG